MKKKLAKKGMLVALILAFGITSQKAISQDRNKPIAGIKGGANISNLYVDNVNDENARIGFHVGVYGQLLSSRVFAIQPEINYSTKGTRIESSFLGIDQTTKFNLNYIDVPVLAVFKLGDSFEIHAGPYWSYLVGANISSDGDLGEDFRDVDRNNFENWDFGVAGGIGFNFSGGQLGLRYNYGLREIAKSDGARALLGDSKNSVGQVYVALNLGK